MPIITIDGNIGSGKTSVLNYLHKFHKIPVDLEPVESWAPYLSKLYDDKSDVFKFQVRVWVDRCWIQEKSDKSVVVVERSPYFIKNVFIKTALDLGMITMDDYNTLIELHKKTDNLFNVNEYIYLRSSPENSLKKIKKRNRLVEKNITIDYITMIHNSHEENLQNAIKNNMKIICIDTDGKTIAEIATEILTYMQTNYPYLKNMQSI